MYSRNAGWKIVNTKNIRIEKFANIEIPHVLEPLMISIFFMKNNSQQVEKSYPDNEISVKFGAGIMTYTVLFFGCLNRIFNNRKSRHGRLGSVKHM